MNEGGGGTIQDYSGNGNTGTFVADTKWVPGRGGPAISFDGTGDQVSLPTINFLSGTVSLWVNSDTDSGTGSILQIITRRVSGTEHPWVFSWSHTNSDFQGAWAHEIGNTFTPAKYNTTLVKDTWYMITLVYSPTVYDIYLNGVLENSETPGSVSVSGAGTHVLGTGGLGNSEWAGQLDSLKIYNRALTPGEVQQLYLDSV